MCVVALVAVACGGEYSDLVPGECLASDAQITGQREPDPDRVGCDSPHIYEVYAVGQLRGDSYPGEATVDAAALQLCVDSLAPTIGVAPADTPDGSEIVFVAPSSTSWTRDDDRRVECVLRFERERVGLLRGEMTA